MVTYKILKNCFIGREGFERILDPNCTMTKQLIHDGYIKAPEDKKRKIKTEKK